MSVNSRLKANRIVGQRKAFYRQRIPKKLGTNILVTSRNGDRKIMQTIRILRKKVVEPAEPVLKNIYQSDTYRKDLR